MRVCRNIIILYCLGIPLIRCSLLLSSSIWTVFSTLVSFELRAFSSLKSELAWGVGNGRKEIEINFQEITRQMVSVPWYRSTWELVYYYTGGCQDRMNALGKYLHRFGGKPSIWLPKFDKKVHQQLPKTVQTDAIQPIICTTAKERAKSLQRRRNTSIPNPLNR